MGLYTWAIGHWGLYWKSYENSQRYQSNRSRNVHRLWKTIYWGFTKWNNWIYLLRQRCSGGKMSLLLQGWPATWRGELLYDSEGWKFLSQEGPCLLLSSTNATQCLQVPVLWLCCLDRNRDCSWENYSGCIHLWNSDGRCLTLFHVWHATRGRWKMVHEETDCRLQWCCASSLFHHTCIRHQWAVWGLHKNVVLL